MNLFRLLYDEGDGDGSADQGADNQAPPGSASQTGSDAGADKGGDSSGQDGAGGKDKATDDQANKPDLKANYAKLQEDHEKLKEQHNTLSKTVGRQASDLGSYKNLEAALGSDSEAAKAALLKIGKARNLDISFGADKSAPALPDDFASMTADELKDYLDNRDRQVVQKVMAAVSPSIKIMQEAQMREKHPDFDDLAPDRRSLEKASITGEIPMEEVYHFAVKGMNMAEAIEAAKVMAVEDYRRGLEKKGGGGKGPDGTDGNAGVTKDSGGMTMADKVTSDYIFGRLKNAR